MFITLTFTFQKEKKDWQIELMTQRDRPLHETIEVSSSSSSSFEFESNDSEDEENTSKQLVVYDPEANGTETIEPLSELIQHQPLPPRILPCVGAFTVQCANCLKWRLIPTKEKYEEIREHILEQPFYCEIAREWRPDVSCDDPADISQDDGRLWAIDKPNIAQPPRGWQRLLRIRGEGSSKFADIYYVAPSSKVLRSKVEIQKYLLEHPEYMEDGVSMSQFSFQTPKPLQENYVRKRPSRSIASSDGNRPLESDTMRPLAIAWAGPDENTELEPGVARQPPPSLELPGSDHDEHAPPSFELPGSDHNERLAKRQTRKSPPEEMCRSHPSSSTGEVEDDGQS
ncbi:hypothetical protein UlMin_007207 [Ulmus minor]